MGVFKKLRERYLIIRLGVRFQNSILYPIFYAILCCISGLNNKEIYVPIVWIMCACIVFSSLFSDDNKVFLVPIFMSYYCLGRDFNESFMSERGKLLQSFDLNAFKGVIFCGCIMFVFLVARLVADGTIKRAFKRRGICFWGIITLDVAFLLNGIFSSKWVYENVIYGFIMTLGLTLSYFLVLSMLDNSKNAVAYGCKTMVCTSYLVLAQMLTVVYELYKVERFIIPYEYAPSGYLINRFEITLSWGISTIITAVIILGIPAAMYLARNCKFSVLSYFSAFVFFLGALLIDSRSAMIVGAVTLFVCMLICCVGGRNRVANRIYTAIIFIIVIGAFLYVKKTDVLPNILELLRLFDISNDSRLTLWKNGIEDFISSPIFGVGFRDGGYVGEYDLFSAMYHNIFIQLLASMGIVGLVAFLVHVKHVVEIFFRRFSANKCLLLMLPFSLVLMSMVDNFFFYPNFQIFYGAFIALAEIYLEDERRNRLASHKKITEKRKPKVLFSFIEAGKGHIIPETAVCESFKKKYGDRAEVIESYFYSETGNESLKKTERLFEGAVRLQNKGKILSWLCRLGNWICGDTFGLYFLMTFTFSGMRSRRPAMKHFKELDADILFTTHWSTAFYAAKLKNPPYTVSICPDAYTNGMFNVDVNDYLMVTESGKKNAEKTRMYAGGNISVVGFPIRPEAKKFYLKRDEIRTELGIGKDDFVVTLSDGGYGIAKMERTIKKLSMGGTPITMIALCGTNKALYERLSSAETPSGIRIIPVSFTTDVLKYVSVADIFCGKSGANSIAEAAYYGVPIIITRCITYIERKIKNYYVKEIKGALYIPSATLASKRILDFAEHPEKLELYKKNLDPIAGQYGSDDIADLLWDRINKISDIEVE